MPTCARFRLLLLLVTLLLAFLDLRQHAPQVLHPGVDGQRLAEEAPPGPHHQPVQLGGVCDAQHFDEKEEKEYRMPRPSPSSPLVMPHVLSL